MYVRIHEGLRRKGLRDARQVWRHFVFPFHLLSPRRQHRQRHRLLTSLEVAAFKSHVGNESKKGWCIGLIHLREAPIMDRDHAIAVELLRVRLALRVASGQTEGAIKTRGRRAYKAMRKAMPCALCGQMPPLGGTTAAWGVCRVKFASCGHGTGRVTWCSTRGRSSRVSSTIRGASGRC